MPTTMPGISITEANHLLQITDRIIASFPEVAHTLGKIGRAESATDPAPLSMIETTITLKPESEWRDGMTIDNKGNIYITAETVCELLRKISDLQLATPITLVMDNARYQRCKLVQAMAVEHKCKICSTAASISISFCIESP